MPRLRWTTLILAPLRLAVRAAWVAFVVLVPLLGVWLASSLAAYRNGPVWLACACGLLLFPLAPLAWEGLARWRAARRDARRGRKVARRNILTTFDRLLLRTLALNLLFLAALLLRFPQTTFAALSTRGDWALDGREGPRVEQVRRGLFAAADALEWLYDAVHDNPYEREARPGSEPPPPVPEASTPAPLPQRPQQPDPPPPTTQTPDTPAPPPPATPERAADGRPLWPLPAKLHPLVANLPPEAETSIAAVAGHIARHEPDRWLRVKALHDYVADRVAYDAAAYFARDIPPQDAETVFHKKVGVCAGYANLLAALGDAAGEEIVVVVGDARTEGSDLTGEGHAWNAAKIDGAWYLIDPTWDAGHVNNPQEGFVKDYDTDNLFVPPAVFAVTHFPEEPRWQLQEPPVSRGDFFRRPVMRAEFFASGLELLRPDRSQVTVADTFEIELRRPPGRFVRGRFHAADGTQGRCDVTYGDTAVIRCDLPKSGTYTVDLFTGPEEYGLHHGVGEFEVHRP